MKVPTVGWRTVERRGGTPPASIKTVWMFSVTNLVTPIQAGLCWPPVGLPRTQSVSRELLPGNGRISVTSVSGWEICSERYVDCRLWSTLLIMHRHTVLAVTLWFYPATTPLPGSNGISLYLWFFINIRVVLCQVRDCDSVIRGFVYPREPYYCLVYWSTRNII